MTSSPLGSYSYDDPAQLHAATFVDSGADDYSADYDAASNVTFVATTLSAEMDTQTSNYDSLEALNRFASEPHGSYEYAISNSDILGYEATSLSAFANSIIAASASTAFGIWLQWHLALAPAAPGPTSCLLTRRLAGPSPTSSTAMAPRPIVAA